MPDGAVHLAEGVRRADVPVIIGPAPNDGIEHTYQVFLRRAWVGVYAFPDFGQKRLRVFLRRGHEQCPVAAADVLTEKVEALGDMRDFGFLGREPKPPLVEKRLNQGTHFVFEQLAGVARHDEVVRISHKVDPLGDFALGETVPFWRELFSQQALQSVEGHVRQRRGDNASLRSALRRGKQSSVFDVSGAQPFFQHLRVRRDVREHPFVADVVVAALNVRFEHPLGRVLLEEHFEALGNGVRCRTRRPESVGMSVREGLGDWLQREQVKRLHRAVAHRRDPQGAQFSVGLRDVDSSQRLRLVAAPPELSDCLVFGRGRAPDCSVHSRRPFALVCCHPFDGKGFAAERVGKKPLQGLDLAPAFFPCCLYEPCLQPSDMTLMFGPVELFPIRGLAGGCTHGILFFRVHLLFPPWLVLPVVS